MIRLDIRQIPDAHIMTRWTRQAKDVLPDHLKGHQKDSGGTKPLAMQSMQLNAKALEAVSKGNTDTETLQVVMKHFIAAIKEVDAILEARREKSEVTSKNSDNGTVCVDSEDGVDIQTDIEGVRGNRYGASGSSAGMSDSEILKLKAPIANRSRGRPRVNRYRTKADIATKKLSTKGKKSATKSAKTKRTEDLATSSTVKQKAKRQRKTIDQKSLEDNRGLPYQSKFCGKCRNPGHTRRTCGREKNPTKSQKTVIRCSKCGLKGHTDEECLVMEEEYDAFYK